MRSTSFIAAATLTCFLLVPSLTLAEDIDLYTGGSSGGDANVLIVLDNESNWDATMDSDPPADAEPAPETPAPAPAENPPTQ